MAVPRSRVSNQRKNTRRAHHAKRPKHAASCTNCGTMRLYHRICASCGYYKDRSVMSSEQA